MGRYHLFVSLKPLEIMECMHCQRELKPDWNFCPDCGQLVREHSPFSLKQHKEKPETEDHDDYPMDFNPQLYEW